MNREGELNRQRNILPDVQGYHASKVRYLRLTPFEEGSYDMDAFKQRFEQYSSY